MATDGTFPLGRVRADTPGVEHVTHLNNAGSSLPPKPVVDTLVEYLHREMEIGGYETANERHDDLEATYSTIASFIGARSHEIAVIENATRAWDMAVYGFPFQDADRVLFARADYVSNTLAFLQLQKRFDIEMVLIDDDEHGQIDLAHLERELAKGAAMVSLTHVPTSGGLVNPAAAVGELCRTHDTCYVLDACQSVGQLPVDVNEIGCDVLSTTGRKFLRGPRGTGFLYVNEDWIDRIEPAMVDLHAADWVAHDHYICRPDARRYENWETYFAGKVGLGAAVAYAADLGIEATWARVEALGASLRAKLRELPGVSVHDLGAEQGGIVTFGVEGQPSGELQARLSDQKINTTVANPHTAKYDLGHRALPPLIRASVHYFNTNDEIDRLIEALA